MKKNKLLFLPILAVLALAGCNPSSESSGGEGGGGEVPPPIIHGDSFEEALKKDYSNMQVAYALSSMMVGEEFGYEYYLGQNNDGLVAVYDGTTAEMYGNDYAWAFYSYYEGKSYAYWDASYYVTKGWISNGSKGIGVGIDYAYFYMPFFLSSITKDDVESVLGTYVVKESAIDKVVSGLKFTYMTNDITYVDIQVNSDGYISRIRGFDDPNNEDYGFIVQLSGFGTTAYPSSSSNPLPERINASNIKTYEEMIGHPEEPDIYISSLDIVINDAVTSDETHQIVMYPDDSIDVSFSYLPTNANKRDVEWHSSNPDVVEILYSYSGHRYLRGIKEGESEIYVSHINGDKQVVSSSVIKVKVNAPKGVEESDQDVYRFAFNSHSGSDGNYVINASNTLLGSEAPYSISTWRMTTTDCKYSDNFEEDDVVLLSNPNSSDYFNTRFEDEVLFDFGNQQVSKISFAYALFSNNAKNALNYLQSVIISVSNDGNEWTTIDVSEEMIAEFNKCSLSTGMSPKVLTREFAPSSMVKVVLKSSMVGGTYALSIGMKDFTFAKNDDCHNYNDPEAVPVTSIVISVPRDRLKVNYSMRFTALVNPDNATNKNVKWESSDPTVISIDSRTGLATALKEGTATIKAVSVTNKNMVSNEITVTAYLQESIVDEDGLLIGKTFFGSDIASGVNKFDVTFKVKNATQAELTLSLMIAGQKFDSVVALSFDSFENNAYEFYSSDNDFARIVLASDGGYIELQYKTADSDVYTLGNASSGVRLDKQN